MPSNTPQTNYEKIRRSLMRDPKRTSLMAGLGLVMMLLWGRLVFRGPASATASFIRRSVSAITDDPAPIAVRSNNAVLEWLSQPKKPIDRNLFAIHLDYYAKASRSTGNHGDGSNGNDTGNSIDQTTDQTSDQQMLQDNLQAQLGKFKLQTTVVGAQPRAMLNGDLVKEGDTIAGFVVVKIATRKVLLQQDGVVLEVTMP